MLLDLGGPNLQVPGNFAALERGIHVPHPEWMVPDDVIEHCTREWGLLVPHEDGAPKIGIDPFAGTGSIPDVINRMGGYCEANELDEEHCRIMEARLAAGSLIRQGDYKTIRTPNFYRGYDYIYTSPPFARFVGPDVDYGNLGERFHGMLAEDGVLIIDSASTAERNGHTIHPAAYTVLYFSHYGFRLKDWRGFQTTPRNGCDNQFTELLFEKRPL